MIGCINLIQFIAPLIIYLGRSFPCHVRCLNVTCRFLIFLVFYFLFLLFVLVFFAVFVELVIAKDSRLCKKQ